MICLALLAFGHYFEITSGHDVEKTDFSFQIPKILEKETKRLTERNDGFLSQKDVSKILFNLLIKIKAFNEQNEK